MHPTPGTEFDWFLIDASGHLACCSTAGYGDVPESLMAGAAPLDFFDQIIDALPVLGHSHSEGRGPGQHRDWSALGARGLYVFDWTHWDGPYERIIRPDVPVGRGILPERVVDWMRPVRTASIVFQDDAAFNLEDLLLDPN